MPEKLRVKLNAPPTVRGLQGYPEAVTPPLTPLEVLQMAEIREAYLRTPPRSHWKGYRMVAGETPAGSVGLPGYPGDLNHDLTPIEVLRARLEGEAA